MKRLLTALVIIVAYIALQGTHSPEKAETREYWHWAWFSAESPEELTEGLYYLPDTCDTEVVIDTSGIEYFFIVFYNCSDEELDESLDTTEG